MNNLLISDAVLLLPGHSLHGKKVSLSIERGKIKQLSASDITPDSKTTTINGAGQSLSPGLFDLNARSGEPGQETKEDVRRGCAGAAAAGSTGVAWQPDTVPPMDTQSGVALIVTRAKGQRAHVHPVGALSKACNGDSLAELYDMRLGGAVAFSD